MRSIGFEVHALGKPVVDPALTMLQDAPLEAELIAAL
jgi:hypothetical protein